MDGSALSPFSSSSEGTSSDSSLDNFCKDIPFFGLETPPSWTIMDLDNVEKERETSNTPSKISKATKTLKAKKNSKSRAQRPTVCAVCERPASCCHYGVPCCNGCKTFFRRYLKCINDLNCLYDGNCNILAFIGKHYCRACRLKRCLSVGMNPNAVGKEDNRIIKEEINTEAVEQPGPSLAIERVLTKEIYRPWRQQNINPLKYTEKLMANFRDISYSDSLLFYYKSNIKTILLQKCELSRKPMQKITFKKNKSPGPSLMIKNGEPESGSEDQDHKFFEDQKEIFTNLHKRHWLTHDLLLTIEQAKTMPWFSNIDIEDQIKIVKNVCLVITMLTQTYYSLKANQETITMPDGTIPLKFKPYGNSLSTLEEEVFYRVMQPMKRIHITFKEYLLLKSLIFAYYMVPDISKETTDILRNCWEHYSSMLMRYLQRKHGISGAAERFGKIVALIESFFQFAAKHRQLYTYGKVFSQQKAPISIVIEEIMA